MTDVFISYSRKDKDFVRQLHDRLSAAQREAWVDWEGIPLTADWWEEIKRGIEAADSFLFIISPDSLTSRVCNQEIEHAVAHNKRLIPIVHREAMSEQVHQALARHNWLYARPDDDLDQVVVQLIEALDTDLEYVRLHTRLLVRAREWEARDRNNSFLLWGVDLTEAEAWLAESGGKEPKPTELQTQYIHASRRATNARQRTLLAGVSVALGATVILALIALALFGVAENRRQESDQRGTEVAQQAGTATSALGLSEIRGTQVALQAATAVAAEATSARRAEEWQALAWAVASENAAAVEDHDLALALAVVANSVPNPPSQASAQLIAAAYAPGTAHVYAGGHDSWIAAMDVSPDGQHIISAGYEGNFVLWNALTGERVKSSTMGEISTMFGDVPINLGSPNVLDYHPTNANRVAFGTGDGRVVLWDTETWSQVWEVDTNELVQAITFSPDGMTIYSGHGDFNIYAWDARDGKALRTFSGHTEDPTALAVSPDNQLLASGGYDATARVWDARSGDLLWTFGPFTVADEADVDVEAVIFRQTADGDLTLITAINDRVLDEWSLATGELLRAFDVADIGTSYNDLALSPDGRSLLAAGIDGTGYLFSLDTGRMIRRYRGHLNPVDVVRFSPDGVYAYTAAQDSTIRRWFANGGALGEVYTDAYPPEPGGNVLTLSHNGRYALTGGRLEGAALVIRDTTTGEILHRLEAHTDSIAEIAVNASDTEALTAGWDNALRRWNIETGELLREYEFPGESVLNVTYAENENHVLLMLMREGTFAFSSRVVRFDLETGEEIYSHDTDFALAFDAAFIHDETQIIVSGAEDTSIGVIEVIDAETGESIRRFDSEHTSAVNSIMLSADESRLLSGGQDFNAFLWDVETGSVIRRFIGHLDIIGSAAFSPDETKIVTAGFDGTVRVWNTETGDEIFAFDAGHGGVRRTVFAPDGGSVYAQYRDGALIQWIAETDPERLTAWISGNRHLRDLTCAERVQFRVGTCEEQEVTEHDVNAQSASS